MGLAVLEVLPGFNWYEGASVLGHTTQMLHLATTERSKPTILSTEPFSEPLYTGEIHPTLRIYACTSCHHLVTLPTPDGDGSALIRTVEELKARGCPRCGTSGFELLDRIGAPEDDTQ
jgi:hypothetical protein